MPYRIIIVDDLIPILEDLEYTIQEEPSFSIVGKATSGKEAIELAKEIPFDLLLMDIEMEDATAGIKATREIIHENPSAIIAFFSAHDTSETVLSAMATGAVDYIVKGVPNEELIRHIKGILNQQPELDNKIQQMLLTEFKRLRHAESQLVSVMNKIKRLTTAETEIIQLLLAGESQKQIAEIRHVELVTIKTQITSILRKFDVKKSKQIIKLIKELELQNLF